MLLNMCQCETCTCVWICLNTLLVYHCNGGGNLRSCVFLRSLGLLRNRTLITLEVGTNALTDTGAGYICEVFKANVKLEGLSLWQNSITGDVSDCV